MPELYLNLVVAQSLSGRPMPVSFTDWLRAAVEYAEPDPHPAFLSFDVIDLRLGYDHLGLACCHAREVAPNISAIWKWCDRSSQQLRESNALSAATHRARSSFAVQRFKSSMGTQEPTSEAWWAEVLAGIRTLVNSTDVTKAPPGAPIFPRPPIPPEQRLATHLQLPTL
jgi:hypothetical protein